IKYSVRDRDLGGAVEEAIKKVQAVVPLPRGYSIDWEGEYESQKRAEGRLATPVVNPASGKTFSKVFMARPEHMTRAIDPAYAVKDVWGNTLPSERELILIRAADVLESMRGEVVPQSR